MAADPFFEDIERLLDDDPEDIPTEEKRATLKEAVDYGRFAPTSVPEDVTETRYNPGIEGYLDSPLRWGDEGWEPVDEIDVLGDFPEYLPTDEAIDRLVGLGPLVEVGAGNGYWAHVINENGGDCVATDLSPRADADAYPTRVNVDAESGGQKVWADVVEVDGVTAVNDHSERAVLMCHPSGSTRWTEDVLDAIEDQPFVFVGEWFPGADATPKFFERLADDAEWTWVDSFPVYDWASMHTRGYVFERQ